MKPPIVVDEGGDAYVFETVEDAALSMEAVDVRNGEYMVYDCEGAVLRAHAASIDSPVEVGLPPEPACEPSRLRAVLADFIRRVGLDRFGISDQELQQAGLSSLIGAAQRFQRGSTDSGEHQRLG